MKKSQILAAIALAFALGVVAPVATISNSTSVSAYSIEDKTASGTEVANAIAAVRANANYKQGMAIVNAYEDYAANNGTNKKYDEYSDTKVKNVVTAMDAIVPGYKVGDIDKNSNSSKFTLDLAQSIIDDAKNNSIYQALVNVNTAYNAVVGTDGTDTELRNALVNAVKAYYTAAKTPSAQQLVFNTDLSSTETFANVKSAITSADGSSKAVINYSGAAAVTSNIEKAQANVDAYNAGYELLNPIVSNKSILTGAGKDAYTEALQNNTPVTLASLAAIINDGSDYQDQNFENGYKPGLWDDVETDLVAAENYENGVHENNYTDLLQITQDYIKAMGLTNATESEVMTQLTGFNGGNTDTPSTNGKTVLSNGIVTIYADGFEFPEGTTVTINEVKAPEGFDVFGNRKKTIYDIKILNADGSKYELTNGQKVVVTIKVAGFTENKAEAFFIENDWNKAVTPLTSARYVDGIMSFTTTHFSYYAVVDPATGDNGDGTVTPETPESGAIAKAEGTASATGILAGIAAALTAAGAAVVAFRNARRNAKKNA